MIFSPSDIVQALANLRAQKTRTLLTALGIVFGVGSVIGMLAIGSGAKEESLRFIEQLGVRNVLIDQEQAVFIGSDDEAFIQLAERANVYRERLDGDFADELVR